MTRANDGSHSFACHPHAYPQVESTIPTFTPQPQSVIALWPVLILRPAEGRRLSMYRYVQALDNGQTAQRNQHIFHQESNLALGVQW